MNIEDLLSPEKRAELDGYLEKVLEQYHQQPYTGRDTHGLFPYVQAIVQAQHPDWSEYRVMIMSTAATAHVAVEIETSRPAPTWREI